MRKAYSFLGLLTLFLTFFIICLVPAYDDSYAMERGDVDPYYLDLTADISLDERPECIALNEETNRVYVGTGQNLTVIDGETNEVILEIQLDFKVEVLAVNTRTNHVYASGDGTPSDKGTYVIDGSSGSVVGYLKNKAWDQHGIAVNPSTNLVYIAYWTTILGYPDLVMVYSGETLSLVTSVEIPGSRAHKYIEISGVGVAVNPITNRVYATWDGKSVLHVIDGNTHTVIKTVEPSSYRTHIMVNQATNYVYIGTVVLDGETLEEVVSSWYEGKLGTIDPTHNLLYTGRIFPRRELCAVDGNTHDVKATLELEETIDKMAVNPKTGKVYVTHKYPAKHMSVILCGIDEKPPSISEVTCQPSIPRPREDTTIIASVVDGESGVDKVTLCWIRNSGTWYNTTMRRLDDAWNATIHGTWLMESGMVFNYYVEAVDKVGNANKSSVYSFTVTKVPTMITCTVSPEKIKSDEPITVSGSIDPAQEAVTVTLTYEKPDGSTFIRTVSTESDGSYSDTYKPGNSGLWSVSASWDGDWYYAEASSSTVSVTVEKRCIIATATYGSELATEVEFLRSFRDNTVMPTFAGSQFMTIFNQFYYSFSPSVASVIADNSALRDIMKVILYPLIGILHVSSAAFSVFSFIPELGVIVAGLIASSLMGIVYFLPTALIISLKKKFQVSVKIVRLMDLIWISSVLVLVLAEVSKYPPMMMVSTGAFVLATISVATLTSFRLALKHMIH